MGFRDLQCFNVVLLARQGWRLLTQPTSLFYRVFQSKYFARCSFWKAKLRSNPSFIWHSILASRALLLRGMKWSIGNGQVVNIWKDEWGVSALTKCSNAREVQWVSELIDEERGVWNVPILHEIFEQDSI